MWGDWGTSGGCLPPGPSRGCAPREGRLGGRWEVRALAAVINRSVLVAWLSPAQSIPAAFLSVPGSFTPPIPPRASCPLPSFLS